MVQHTARDVSDFLDPIWERQKDTGREQKDGTDELGEDCSISLCAVVEVRAVGTYVPHSDTGAEARNDGMRKWPPANPRAGRPQNERRTDLFRDQT